MLVTLGNRILEQGVFPDCLKEGIIILKYKGGCLNDINNYRHITLLSPLSKLYERLIFTRMVNYLNKNALLNPDQYGFRQGHSGEDAIQGFVDYAQGAFFKFKFKFKFIS